MSAIRGSSQSSHTSIDLGGWDTINAIRFDTFNGLVKAQNKTPGSFATKPNKFDGQISGTWGPWETFADHGASGKDIRMSCPVAKGIFSDAFGTTTRLDGTIVYITVQAQSVDTPGVKVTDPTAIPGTGKVTSLKLAKPVSPAHPTVRVDKFSTAIPSAAKRLFADWFTAHIESFEALFHVAVLNAKVDTTKDGNFQWVKPQHLGYATITDENGFGMFGALCQCTVGPYGKLPPMVPAGMLNGIPKGSNSVFAIGGPQFTEHFLRHGAVSAVPGSKHDDFEIYGNGLKVRNKVPLTWLPLDFSGETVHPKIPVGGIDLSVSEDQIQIDFKGLTWDHPLAWGIMGSDVFSLSFSQAVYLGIRRNSRNEPVFVTSNTPFGTGKPAREVPQIMTPHITVMPDKTAIQAQRVVAIVNLVAGVLGGIGALIKVATILSSGARIVGDTAATVATMINEGESVFDLMIEADSINSAITDVEIAAGNTEALALATGQATSLSARALTYFTRFCMMGGFTGLAGFGLNYWQSSQIDQDNQFHPDSLPSLNHFADNVVGAAHWPKLDTWHLQEARLAKSLLLYGTYTASTTKGTGT